MFKKKGMSHTIFRRSPFNSTNSPNPTVCTGSFEYPRLGNLDTPLSHLSVLALKCPRHPDSRTNSESHT